MYDYLPYKSVRLEVDEVQTLVHGVKKGLGIGYIANYLAQPLLTNGELCRVLPEWQTKPRTLSMLYRDRDNLPLRVRLFVEFILAHCLTGY
ncbi:LysR substrate-binding domain-containing protein [Vibrio sp. PP-XX7]